MLLESEFCETQLKAYSVLLKNGAVEFFSAFDRCELATILEINDIAYHSIRFIGLALSLGENHVTF
jgi:hypothetical protein